MPAAKRTQSKIELQVAAAIKNIQAATKNTELKEKLKEFQIMNVLETSVDANKKVLIIVVPVTLSALCRK